MASGSKSTILTNENGGKYNLVASFNENSTSTANNTSNITCTAKLTKNNSRFEVTNAGVLKVYWHDNQSGVDTEWASLAVGELGYNTTERSASATKNVTHKADGTLSGYAKATWERTNAYGHYAPPSGNISTDNTALTTIPRASAPTLSNSTFNIGDTITVNTNRASSSFTHTITMTYGSTTTTIGTNVGASLSYNTANIANGLYAVIPNGTSLNGTITCTTYSGSTNVGSKTCSFTAKAVANNAKPTFSNFTFADTNSTTTAITGNNQVMISGKSTLAATITSANKATARYSATMKKYTFAVAGLSAEQTYTTSDITKSMGSPGVAASELPSGTRDFVVTAIDSRGYSTAVTKKVTIVPYSAPAINATAKRANGFENTTTVNISGTFSRIEVSGTAKNTVNASSGVQYRYKPQNSTTWTIDWTNKAATIDTANGKVTVAAFTHNLDNQTAYDFQFRITDRLQTTTASIVVPVGQPAFWIGADGRVSVGGMPSYAKGSSDTGLLDVKGKIYASNGITTTGDITTQYGTSGQNYRLLHLGGYTDVPRNANLNSSTYCQVGKYACRSAADGSTITNNPSGGAFFMEVRNLLNTGNLNLSASWQYIERTLRSGTSDKIYRQYVNIGGTAGSLSYGAWKVYDYHDNRAQAGEWSQFYFAGTNHADGTQTIYTKKGTALTVSWGNGGSNLSIIGGGSGIKFARQTWSTKYSAMNNNYGVTALASGSTIYTRYLGCVVQGDIPNSGEYNTNVDGGNSTGGYYGDLAKTNTTGTRNSSTCSMTMTRVGGNTNGWVLQGTISSDGSRLAMDFDAHVTAYNANFVPSVYQRGEGQGSTTGYSQLLEVYEG